MSRNLCILTGLILIGSPLLSGRVGRAELDLHQMTSALGGNINQTPESRRCDKVFLGIGKGILYVGCKAVGGNCTQCGVLNPDGSLSAAKFFRLKTTATTTLPGWMFDTSTSPPPVQGCGNVFTGTCIVNPDPTSSGFFCQGTLGVATCNSQPAIINQPSPIIGGPASP